MIKIVSVVGWRKRRFRLIVSYQNYQLTNEEIPPWRRIPLLSFRVERPFHRYAVRCPTKRSTVVVATSHRSREVEEFLSEFEDRCLAIGRAAVVRSGPFYDLPAAHWQSIPKTSPVESTFATIRHRTKRCKGCLSRHTMLHMMSKLGQCAEKKWRRLRGFNALAKVITGVKFKDFIKMKHVDQKVAWFILLDTTFDNRSCSILLCASIVGTGRTVTIN